MPLDQRVRVRDRLPVRAGRKLGRQLRIAAGHGERVAGLVIGTRNAGAVGVLGFAAWSILLLILLLVVLAAIVNRHRLNGLAFRMRRALGT